MTYPTSHLLFVYGSGYVCSGDSLNKHADIKKKKKQPLDGDMMG